MRSPTGYLPIGRRAIWRLAFALTLLSGAIATPSLRAQGEREPIGVVATTGMVADIVQRVAGHRGRIRALMGSGVDPHLYKLTRSDTAAMLGADAVFYSGLHLEGKMTDALERIAGSGKPTYAVTEEIDPAYLLVPEQFQGHPDPHVWMDPIAWSRCVGAVADRFVGTLDPQDARVYRDNCAAYQEQLADLDRYITTVIRTIPEDRRVLVTAHDAFNYFGRRYGMEVLGIQGISTESEAGVREIERLVDLLVERQVPAVFVETTVPDRSVRALIAGAKARGHDVVIGGSLFSDAMGSPGTYEGTYIGMLDHNATTITRALGGKAPERGMQELLLPPHRLNE